MRGMFSRDRLHFEDLSPLDFERFCLALLSMEGHQRIRHWGASGSEKSCDLVSTAPDGRRVVTQWMAMELDNRIRKFPGLVEMRIFGVEK